MRILLACEFYYPSVGGVQEVMRQLAERLVERGHAVTVATSFLAERKSRELNGVRIAEFKVSGNLVGGLEGDVEAYRRYVIESDCDVFMVKAAQQWTFDALIAVLDGIRKPKVFIPCGFSGLHEPAYADYFRLMPEALHKFDRLIFYASNYRDINFAREHGIKKFVVIPNGASEREFSVQRDSGFRQRHGILPDAFVILTVGSLTRLKGHLELAKAFERCEFKGRPAFLILNGNVPRPASFTRYGFFTQRLRRAWITARGRYRNEGVTRLSKWILRTLVIRARLGWVLRALGYIAPETVEEVVARINSRGAGRRAVVKDLPRAELVQAFLNSDLFVFASKVEYSPLVLYEAAAAGLPFLSVSVGNAEEIAKWTGGGVVLRSSKDDHGFTQADPAALAREMGRLVESPAELARFAKDARQNWETQFGWDKIVLLYEKVFNECTASAPSEAGSIEMVIPIQGRVRQ